MTDASLDPRLHAYRPDLADTRLRGQVTADRFVAPQPATVTAPVLPVFSRPEDGHGRTTELLFGEAVDVFETRDGWSWVQNRCDGYVGYVDAASLHTGSHATARHRVTARHSHIYAEPAVKAARRADLPYAARLAVADIREGWAQLADDRGFVPATHLEPLTTCAADPVTIGERFLGSPYLWGGRSPTGLDCSALVQLAFAACGLDLPRDSDQQFALGDPVEGPPQRGDLAFFPGHVGLMIDPVRLLHANATHMAVTIDPVATVAGWTEARGGLLGIRRHVWPIHSGDNNRMEDLE